MPYGYRHATVSEHRKARGDKPSHNLFRGMAERLIADVCYTSVGHTTVGSNPSPSIFLDSNRELCNNKYIIN